MVFGLSSEERDAEDDKVPIMQKTLLVSATLRKIITGARGYSSLPVRREKIQKVEFPYILSV